MIFWRQAKNADVFAQLLGVKKDTERTFSLFLPGGNLRPHGTLLPFDRYIDSM
jgi:hypothetical protein